MDFGELHDLLFRWLHVMSAALWIGYIWSLVFAQQIHQPTADAWIRGSGNATWLTCVAPVAHHANARRVGLRDSPLAEMAVDASKADLKVGTTYDVSSVFAEADLLWRQSS